jgi:hypothetical protein
MQSNHPLEADGFHRAVLDAIPLPVLVVDTDMRIVAANATAVPLLGGSPDEKLRTRSGDALGCMTALGNPNGCGHADACSQCVLRSTVAEAAVAGGVIRRRARFAFSRHGRLEPAHLLVTAAPIQHVEAPRVLLMIEDMATLIELEGILPMCANCKRVRDGQDAWSSVESYFNRRLDLDVSHGLCPDCLQELYPEFAATRTQGAPGTR